MYKVAMTSPAFIGGTIEPGVTEAGKRRHMHSTCLALSLSVFRFDSCGIQDSFNGSFEEPRTSCDPTVISKHLRALRSLYLWIVAFSFSAVPVGVFPVTYHGVCPHFAPRSHTHTPTRRPPANHASLLFVGEDGERQKKKRTHSEGPLRLPPFFFDRLRSSVRQDSAAFVVAEPIIV